VVPGTGRTPLVDAAQAIALDGGVGTRERRGRAGSGCGTIDAAPAAPAAPAARWAITGLRAKRQKRVLQSSQRYGQKPNAEAARSSPERRWER
jgi:hypothetical protein